MKSSSDRYNPKSGIGPDFVFNDARGVELVMDQLKIQRHPLAVSRLATDTFEVKVN